ncbi:alpha/beta hydrolase fold domain-containing protein [Blastopirellula marina]|nr:alpha/beta hydrolase fold domain-containing protein [Blastopirellula marina]
MKKDLTYAKIGDRELKLDLYLPEGAKEPLPLVIWVHGGGWAKGSKAGCPARRLAADGYVVASVDYRLSGEAAFPAQIEDCKAAVRWLRANADKYGINPDRIGVWGSSAGGHLVAMLGTTSDSGKFDVGDHLDVSSRVQAVCDYYGPTDLLRMDEKPAPGARMKHLDPASPESLLLGGPILENKEKAATANPITYISDKTPPFLIVHGDVDPTVSHFQSELLFDALKKASLPVHFHTIEGAGHGKGFGGADVTEMVDQFFAKTLKSDEPVAAEAKTSTSKASEPAGAAAPMGRGRQLTYEQVMARADRNKDGQVDKDEFAGPPRLFTVLDRNGDGVVDKKDF